MGGAFPVTSNPNRVWGSFRILTERSKSCQSTCYNDSTSQSIERETLQMIKSIFFVSWRIMFSLFVSFVTTMLCIAVIWFFATMLVRSLPYAMNIADSNNELFRIPGIIIGICVGLYTGYRYGWRNKMFISK